MSALFFDKDVTFASLPLDRRLFKALARQRLIHPSIIQARMLPLALQGRDLAVTARTGAGKTLAYAIPVLQTLLTRIDLEARSSSAPSSSSSTSSSSKSSRLLSSGPRALILLPTRELCLQVKGVFEALLHFAHDSISLCVLTAERNISTQVAALRNLPTIVIATPARLAQHLSNGALTLKDSLIQLVLDEADLLLSFDYESEIRALVPFLPSSAPHSASSSSSTSTSSSSSSSVTTATSTSRCQTMLLSATLSPQLTSLSRVLMHDPAVVKLDESSMPATLSQFYIATPANDKGLLAYSLIKLRLIQGKCLFFVNQIDTAFRLKLLLEQFSITCAILNETLPYNSRLSILTQFNRGVFDFLIATDRATVRHEAEIGADQDELTANAAQVKVEEAAIKEEENDGAKVEEIASNADDDDGRAPVEHGNEADDDALKLIKHVVDESIVVKTEVAQKDSSSMRQQRVNKRKRDFGVSRGIDFQGVNTVINYDFPISVKSYIHRVGRTARAGKVGTALSLTTNDDDAALQAVLAHQREENSRIQLNALPQLQRLNFNVKDVEGFRYRVDDVTRGLTPHLIREARLTELKAEILNSTKLKAHFEDNPRELDLLRHDRVLRPAKIQKHLSHVPDYLVPVGFSAEDLQQDAGTGKRRVSAHSREDDGNKKGKQPKRYKGGKNHKRKQDPLRSFSLLKNKGRSTTASSSTSSAPSRKTHRSSSSAASL